MTTIGLLVIGLAAGVLSGMFGIGGGVLIVPALIYLFKLKQIDATATSLAALIPPVGLLGAYEYYRNGNIQIWAAAAIAAGMFFGAYFGARITIGLPSEAIKRIYALFLMATAVKMFFFE